MSNDAPTTKCSFAPHHRAERCIDARQVVFSRFGLELRWVIECKKWTNPIPKEKVLALRGVVNDLGADKGILVADSGFQPGAVSAATNTNITLTTFADLHSGAKGDLHSAILEALERKTLSLQDRHRQLGPLQEMETVDDDGTKWTAYYPQIPPNVEPHMYSKMGTNLTFLIFAFQWVKMDDFPISLRLDDSENKEVWFDDDGQLVWPDRSAETSIWVENVEEFIANVTRIVESVDRWLAEQEHTVDRTG